MSTFMLRFVCTANLCRSPLAERIAVLRTPATAAARRWLVVTSAGTHARDGMGMHPPAARRLTSMGADPAGFSSRRLTAAMVAEDDLVLTADLTQRDAVIALCPAASRRTFVIGEFARLLQHTEVPRGRAGAADGPAEAARNVVARAARYRGRVPWREPALDEIADPDSEAAVSFCAEQVDRAVTQIVVALSGVTPKLVPLSTRATDPRS
ncbi:hypothetical protein [Streptacidiphilus pinicola]|nr:hypothetical protein [Streptacidiphilus pinicola]